MPQDSNGTEPNVTWYNVEQDDLLPEDFELEDLEFDTTTADFETAIDAIKSDSLTPFDLTGFSDITRKQMHELRAVWQPLSDESRRTLSDIVTELAGEYLYTDFGRFWEVLLDDPDTEVRLNAATHAFDTIVSSVIKPLVRLAESDPSMDVRGAAIRSLSSFTLAMDMEQELDDKDVKLLTRLKDWAQDETWPSVLRGEALASWAAFTGDDETGGLIEQFALSDDDDLHLGASRAMAAWGPGKLVPFLERQLSSNDADHREAAARALGQAEDTGVVPMLTMLARTDKEPDVRSAAYQALGEQGSKQALQALQELRKHAAEGDLEILDYAIAQANDMVELEDMVMFEFDEEDEEV